MFQRKKPLPSNAPTSAPTTPRAPQLATPKKTISKPVQKKNATKQQPPKHHHYEFPKNLNTYLGQKGYTILKSELTKEDREMLEKKLMVIPKTNTPSFAGTPDNSFPAYRESTKKYYVPRFFGIKHFGEPKEYAINEGEDISVPFVKTLRENQIPVVEAYMARVKDQPQGGGLLELPCAYGKCLARNTEILMFDGTIKMVQDICVGDKIMGDDATPRTILSVCTGREKMVNIYNKKHGVDYTTNMSHILSLKPDGVETTVDICVADYLKMDIEKQKGLLGYRVPIDFPYKYLPVHPYEYGYHLGTNIEYGEFTVQHRNGYTKDRMERVERGRIPHHYLCNNRKNRLLLLAGLIDAIGMLEKNKFYILTPDLVLLEDILFLCRSLGFFCVRYKNSHNCLVAYNSGVNNETHSKISDIPIRREKHAPHNIDKHGAFDFTENMGCDYPHKNNLAYKINATVLEEDVYYGFEIDGNRRFLLADFTVTHNTVLSLNIISELGKKTLVIVNKEFLMNQWIERIAEFLPSARVGRIQGQIVDIENKDIVLGMLQSISMKDYDAEVFSSFGLTIIDEVHHISSEVFSRALFKIVSKYMLGLSATMERKDGTTGVFKMFLGDVAFKGEHTEKHNVCVRGIEYVSNDPEFNEVECDFRGQPKYSTMITKLCSFGPRSDFIVRVVQDLFEEEPESQIMILAHNRNLLEYLHDAIAYKKIASVGYYLGGMKERDLKITETKQVVIATYAMAAEALDIKTLSCLVMATPKTDIVQSVGRILRMKHKNPRVVDIVDKHDLFQRQWGQRKKFYRKCNYRIRTIESFHYEGMNFDWDTDKTWKRVFEPAREYNSSGSSASDTSDNDIEDDAPKKTCMIDIGALSGLHD